MPLARSTSPALSAPSEESPAATGPSNWALVRRMLGLGWEYRWGCIRLLVLQGLLLLTAISALRLVGLGIDLIRWHVKDAKAPPPYPFGLGPPADWPPLAQRSRCSAATPTADTPA